MSQTVFFLIFRYYCTLGDPLNRKLMSSSKFIRLLRDCGIIPSVSQGPVSYLFERGFESGGSGDTHIYATSVAKPYTNILPIHFHTSPSRPVAADSDCDRVATIRSLDKLGLNKTLKASNFPSDPKILETAVNDRLFDRTRPKNIKGQTSRPESAGSLIEGHPTLKQSLPLQTFFYQKLPPLSITDADLLFVQIAQYNNNRNNISNNVGHQSRPISSGSNFLDFEKFAHAMAEVASRVVSSPTTRAALHTLIGKILLPLADSVIISKAEQISGCMEACLALNDHFVASVLDDALPGLKMIFLTYAMDVAFRNPITKDQFMTFKEFQMMLTDLQVLEWMPRNLTTPLTLQRIFKQAIAASAETFHIGAINDNDEEVKNLHGLKQAISSNHPNKSNDNMGETNKRYSAIWSADGRCINPSGEGLSFLGFLIICVHLSLVIKPSLSNSLLSSTHLLNKNDTIVSNRGRLIDRKIFDESSSSKVGALLWDKSINGLKAKVVRVLVEELKNLRSIEEEENQRKEKENRTKLELLSEEVLFLNEGGDGQESAARRFTMKNNSHSLSNSQNRFSPPQRHIISPGQTTYSPGGAESDWQSLPPSPSRSPPRVQQTSNAGVKSMHNNELARGVVLKSVENKSSNKAVTEAQNVLSKLLESRRKARGRITQAQKALQDCLRTLVLLQEGVQSPLLLNLLEDDLVPAPVLDALAVEKIREHGVERDNEGKLIFVSKENAKLAQNMKKSRNILTMDKRGSKQLLEQTTTTLPPALRLGLLLETLNSMPMCRRIVGAHKSKFSSHMLSVFGEANCGGREVALFPVNEKVIVKSIAVSRFIQPPYVPGIQKQNLDDSEVQINLRQEAKMTGRAAANKFLGLIGRK